jgi:hypothetical protein
MKTIHYADYDVTTTDATSTLSLPTPKLLHSKVGLTRFTSPGSTRQATRRTLIY